MRAPHRSTMRLLPLAVCATLFALATPARLPAGDLQVDGKLVSTAEAGTPPLEVSSPDRVENLNADMVDGMHAGSFRFHNVIRVGKNGTGDFDTIQAAIDSLGPGYPNRLILVGPGVYPERVVLPANSFNLVLQGSGQGVTMIRAGGSDTFDASAAAVVLGRNSSLRDLTVEPKPGKNYAIGIFNTDDYGELRDVEVQLQTNIYTESSLAIVGVYNQAGADLTIYDSNIHMLLTLEPSLGYAIWNESTLSVQRSRIWVLPGPSSNTTYGVYNTGAGAGGSVQIDHSRIVGGTRAIEHDDEFSTVVRHTHLHGSVEAGVECAAVTKNAQFFADECPPWP